MRWTRKKPSGGGDGRSGAANALAGAMKWTMTMITIGHADAAAIDSGRYPAAPGGGVPLPALM